MFWLGAGVVGYVYAGYPLLLWALTRLVPRRRPAPVDAPPVTLVVPAHNEAHTIGARVTSALRTAYPRERFELIVVSDGSTDGTDRLAAEAGGDRLVLLRSPERRGKAHAMNLGAARATGTILVFSDANVVFEPDAIRHLVLAFGDPSVGAVVGRVILRPEGSVEAVGESLYMRYERLLHRLESDLSSMVTVDGAMFAIRRSLYEPLPAATVVDDFVTVMRVVQRGYRIGYAPGAVGYEAAAATVRDELRRKIRIVAGGYRALVTLRSLLNPLHHPLIALQLVSHKLLRWLTPLVLLVIAGATVALADRPLYLVALGVQAGFYLLALAATLVPGLRACHAFYLPFYFSAINLAALLGLARFLSGGQSVLWARTRR